MTNNKPLLVDVGGEVIGTATQGESFIFDPKDTGHTLTVGTTRKGMSAMFEVLQDQCANAGGTVQVVDVGLTANG